MVSDLWLMPYVRVREVRRGRRFTYWRRLRNTDGGGWVIDLRPEARQTLTGEAGGSNQSDQDVGNGAEGTV